MNTLFGFYFEVWHYIQTSRRDEHWIIEIIEMTDGIKPSWQPSSEKIHSLDIAYNHSMKNDENLVIIKAFVKAAKADLSNFKDKKIQNLLAEISGPTHLDPILQ